MIRILIATAIAVLSAAVGQIMLRKGMQIIGPLESYGPMDLISYFLRALSQPYVVGGTILSAGFYFCMLAVLSWTDVSVGVPLTAVEYAVTALLAVLLLNERVPTMRWIGIVLVVIGVYLISGTIEEDKRAEPPATITQRNTN